MARVKGGLGAKKRHNRTLKLAKGYRGARSKQYRVAKQSVMRALTSSYAGRKERKRQFRQLWIARINAAARLNGLSYSQFMHGLKLAGADLNRKVLADMAVTDAEGFAKLVEVAKKAFSSPEIQDWYSGKWTLFNECAIIYKEKGVLQTRRPDRVMMKDNQVVVVDFKFGKENPKYNKQVKGYMQLLTKMGYKNITGYLWYVDEEKIEKV